MRDFRWLDTNRSPILHLKTNLLEMRLQPVEQASYEAGNVYFEASEIIRFGRDLRVMISNDTFETKLSCRGTEFELRLIYKNRRVNLELSIRDYFVFPPGEAVLRCDFQHEDTEFIHWWRNSIEEFQPKLDEWMIEYPPEFDWDNPYSCS